MWTHGKKITRHGLGPWLAPGRIISKCFQKYPLTYHEAVIGQCTNITHLPFLEVSGTSLAVQWLRLRLPLQRVWVPSLARELTFHMPHGQKIKTRNRSIAVTNSMKTFKEETSILVSPLHLEGQWQALDLLLNTTVGRTLGLPPCTLQPKIRRHQVSLSPSRTQASENYCLLGPVSHSSSQAPHQFFFSLPEKIWLLNQHSHVFPSCNSNHIDWPPGSTLQAWLRSTASLFRLVLSCELFPSETTALQWFPNCAMLVYRNINRCLSIDLVCCELDNLLISSRSFCRFFGIFCLNQIVFLHQLS